MSAPPGHEVVLWCEDSSHHNPVRIVGLTRLADEAVSEGRRPWVGDHELRQMGRGGGRDASTGLYRWYQEPAPSRCVQVLDERGAQLRCPVCKHSRKLSWELLHPLLEKLGAHGVARLTLQGLAGMLTKQNGRR